MTSNENLDLKEMKSSGKDELDPYKFSSENMQLTLTTNLTHTNVLRKYDQVIQEIEFNHIVSNIKATINDKFYPNTYLIIDPNSLRVSQQDVLKPLEKKNDLAKFDFNLITVYHQIALSQRKLRIEVLGSTCTFSFEFESTQTLEKFLPFFYFSLTKSLGYQKNMIGISLKKEFYKVICNKNFAV